MPLAILTLLERCPLCGAPPGQPCSSEKHNIATLRNAIKTVHPSHRFIVMTAKKEG